MPRSLARGTALAALATLALYATAEAANPVKGATYVGSRGNGSTSWVIKVSLKVAPSGTSATALMYCGSSHQPTSGAPRFAIVRGHFRAVRKTGSLTLWTMTGRFVSPTRVVATLNIVSICDGKQGSITLEKK